MKIQPKQTKDEEILLVDAEDYCFSMNARQGNEKPVGGYILMDIVLIEEMCLSSFR